MNDNKTQNNMNQNEKQVDSKDVEKYSRMIVGMSNMLKYGLISDLFFRYQGSTHMIGSQSAGKTSLLNDILNSEAENGFENRELLKTDEKAGTTMSTGILVGYNIEEKYAYKILYRNEITKGGNIALGENKGQKDDEILKSMKKEIEEMHQGLGIKSDKFELITINNRSVLKNTFDSIMSGPSINVCFTQKNKIYSFGVFWGPDEKEECIQEFDEFLETVSID